MIEKILSLPSSVLIGSRAFNLHDRFSDTDICVLQSELPANFKNQHPLRDTANYLNVIPKGGSRLIRIREKEFEMGGDLKIDIILFKRSEHIEIVRNCIDEMKQIPRYLLKNRNIRVVLFEELLIGRGFIRKRPLGTTEQTNPYGATRPSNQQKHDDIMDAMRTSGVTQKDYNQKMRDMEIKKMRKKYDPNYNIPDDIPF